MFHYCIVLPFNQNTFYTNSEDEVVLYGVFFPSSNAVHASWPLDGPLLDVTAARRLQPLLYAICCCSHIDGLGDLNFKGASFDMLLIKTQRQVKSSLFGGCEQVFIGAVFIVQNFPFTFAAIR